MLFQMGNHLAMFSLIKQHCLPASEQTMWDTPGNSVRFLYLPYQTDFNMSTMWQFFVPHRFEWFYFLSQFQKAQPFFRLWGLSCLLRRN